MNNEELLLRDIGLGCYKKDVLIQIAISTMKEICYDMDNEGFCEFMKDLIIQIK